MDCNVSIYCNLTSLTTYTVVVRQKTDTLFSGCDPVGLQPLKNHQAEEVKSLCCPLFKHLY